MRRLSPELLMGRFIKSATNGRNITVRKRRVLTLLALPVWITGIGWACILFFEGCKAYSVYRQEMNRRSISPLDFPKEDYYRQAAIKYQLQQSHPGDTLTDDEYRIIKGEKPLPDWLNNQLKAQPSGDIEVINEAKSGMFNLLAIPLFILLFFMLPWMIIKTVFWIIDADNASV